MSEQAGTFSQALAQTARLLGPRPDLAEEQAREILKVMKGQPQALFYLGVALRMQGKTAEALAILEPLAAIQPHAADVLYEVGLAWSAQGESRKAIRFLERTVAANPKHPQAWRALGDEKGLLGDEKGADAAYIRHLQASVNDPRLIEAGTALYENKLAVAERILRGFLKENPTDAPAIRMLAETASRLGRHDDAERLLARAVELAPSFTAARHNHASVLLRLNKPREAMAQAEILLRSDPRNPGYRALYAAVLSQLGEYAQSSRAYASLLSDFPNQPKGWMSYGHSLKTLGRQEESIAAYRQAIERLPSLGEVWWSLANLKTFRFTPEDIQAMRAQLARTELSHDDRLHFEFALGKALEDRAEYEESFRHYETGNALRRQSLPYHPEQTEEFAARMKAVFTPELFARHAGDGCLAPDPIFVVGLPRSGSTLVEQILASHSQVEGTMELHDIGQLARGLARWSREEGETSYPEIVETLSAGTLKETGETYLARAQVHRKLGRPFFVDKMPHNFLHIGLIQLILPNAKIIDARRNPMACCFSCFKQHFARGQSFTYGLEGVGRYYTSYVSLMEHYDRVMPGRIHRVIYEDMVADPEVETRRLLAYCGLDFEPGCLRFYENDRAVRTASSEQVRMPIFADGLDQWRHYEPWLGPLKAVLRQPG
ncbi:MAG TPA: sulfotransferase [Rhizomicrobium sp.]|jgi:tetratricopeptide (TPR) repeat protein